MCLLHCHLTEQHKSYCVSIVTIAHKVQKHIWERADTWEYLSMPITAGMLKSSLYQDKPARWRDAWFQEWAQAGWPTSGTRVKSVLGLILSQLEVRAGEKAAVWQTGKLLTCFPVFLTWRCLPRAHSIHLLSLEARGLIHFRKRKNLNDEQSILLQRH